MAFLYADLAQLTLTHFLIALVFGHVFGHVFVPARHALQRVSVGHVLITCFISS